MAWIANALIVVGCALVVVGVLFVVSTYHAPDRYHFMAFSCGSVMSPAKHVPATVNCNRGGRALVDIALLASGVALLIGGVVARAKTSPER